MRLLIMSDGTPHGTRVTDEYRKPIEGVTAIKWKQTIGESPVIQLTLSTADVGLMVNDPELATEPSPAAEMVQEKRKYEKRTTAK
jgi:hypothetical protein